MPLETVTGMLVSGALVNGPVGQIERSSRLNRSSSSTTSAGLGGALSTVTVTSAESFELPARSYARARRLCAPLVTVVVFQAMAYGLVAACPATTPSTSRSTRASARSSAAATSTPTVPATVAFAFGATIDAVGGVTSTVDAGHAYSAMIP